MATCANIHAPSDPGNGGTVTCEQFNATMLELKIICEELNAIGSETTEIFTGLTVGAAVVLADTPAQIKSVYRNGIWQLPTADYGVVGSTVTMTQSFGASPGGTLQETLVVIYIPA